MHFFLVFACVLCLLLWIPQIKLECARDGCNLPAAGLDVHISRVTGVCGGATQNKTLANLTFKCSSPLLRHRSDPERWSHFSHVTKEKKPGFVNNGIRWQSEGFTARLRRRRTSSLTRAVANLAAWTLLSWLAIFNLLFSTSSDCFTHHYAGFGVIFYTDGKDSLFVQEGKLAKEPEENGQMYKMFSLPYQRRYLGASALEYCCQLFGTLLLVWVLRKRRRGEGEAKSRMRSEINTKAEQWKPTTCRLPERRCSSDKRCGYA